MPSVEPSAERAARNETLFRDANARIDERRGELGIDADRTPFLCECEDEACNAVLLLSREEYAAIRSGGPRRFFVLHGHVGNHSRVVSDHGEYLLVEKVGAAGEAAERMTDG